VQFSCRPTFHWTDQKLRVHAFYCVLVLLLLNLLRRKLAKAGIPLSVVKMMDTLTDIHEVTLLYPDLAPRSPSCKPSLRTWTRCSVKSSRPSASSAIAARRSYNPPPGATAPVAAWSRVRALGAVD